MNKKILAQTIPVITSGTVAAGGVLISAVDGTAFIDVDTSKTGAADFSTAILAAVANNDVIELTSKTNGRKIYAYAKAAGSGTLGTDNLGGELVDAWTNSESFPYEIFTSSGNLITQAVNSNSWGYAIKNLSSTQYKLYKNSNTTTVASGKTPFLQFYEYANFTINNSSYKTSININELLVYGSDNNYSDFSVSSFSLKQVLAPSSAGITLTNTAGGTTYNFALKDSSFTYNDSAGYDYRIISSTAYGKLIATQSPVSGTLHIATKNGEAMFFHDSIDFSAYAGTDAGSTPYLFVFYDNTGKSAQAYAGAFGGGEASTDILSGWDLTSGWFAMNATIIDSNSFSTVGGGAGVYKTDNDLQLGRLYKIAHSVSSTDDFQFRFINSGVNMLYPASGGMGNGSYHTYKDNVSSLTGKPYLRHNSAGQTDITSMSCSYLTDVPATGLHLMSAKDGTTRNMKSMESGFNPNTITRVNIYRAY